MNIKPDRNTANESGTEAITFEKKSQPTLEDKGQPTLDSKGQSTLESGKIAKKREVNGPRGLEPTRYGDWESKGRCVDF